jgi:hypothetical protein
VDLLIRSHSIYWTAEVKTPGKNSKRRTKAQIDHYEDAARHNAPHCLLLSVEEAVHARNRIISRLI